MIIQVRRFVISEEYKKEAMILRFFELLVYNHRGKI